MIRGAAIALLAGCSSILGIEDLGGPAAPDGGTPDGDPSTTFTLAGAVIRLEGGNDPPLANHPIELLRAGMTPQVSTTNGQGRYSFAFPAGQTVDGVVRVVSIGGIDRTTDSYPLPFATNQTFDAVAISDAFIQQRAMEANEPIAPDAGFIFITVVGANSQPAGNVVVTTDDPNTKVAYGDNDGRVDVSLMTTSASGTAYMFNVLASSVRLATSFSGNGTAPRTIDLQGMNGVRRSAFVVLAAGMQ
jgi:hypothetical protein